MSRTAARPGFDPRLLVALVVLGDERHFGRAAARLGISQPTLSRQIARLEEQVGTRLLSRSTRRVTVTPAGARFLSAGREVVARAARAQTDLARDQGALTVHLADPLHPLVRHIAATFCQAHPGIDVTLVESSPTSCIEAVRSGAADVGFAMTHGLPGSLRSAPIVATPIGVACATTHPLADEGEATWDALHGERIIMAAPGVADGWNAFLRAQLAVHEVAYVVPTVPRVPKAMYLAASIARGRGVLLCPACAFAPLPDGVTWVPLTPVVVQEIGAVHDPATSNDAVRPLVAWALSACARVAS